MGRLLEKNDRTEDICDFELIKGNLPWRDRLKLYWDTESYYKSFWLTGYILITWKWDYNFWGTLKTLEIGFYKGGSYE